MLSPFKASNAKRKQNETQSVRVALTLTLSNRALRQARPLIFTFNFFSASHEYAFSYIRTIIINIECNRILFHVFRA